MHLLPAAGTVILTVIGGALTLVVGQILVRGFLEPALDLKREIGKIAYSLVFYANRRFGAAADVQEITRQVFRTHAARLRELANTITGYSVWRALLGLPSIDNVFKASADLIGHSNFPDVRDGTKYDNSPEIRELLGIRD